jgi:hypothetical protein
MMHSMAYLYGFRYMSWKAKRRYATIVHAQRLKENRGR